MVDSIAGSTKSTYDALNRLTQVLDINGTITYAYSDAGLRTNMTVAGQNTVFYTYDNANRLTNVLQGTFTTSLAYDDDGRRTSLTLPNGINVLYSYDPVSRLTNVVYLASATNAIAYGYDQLGNRVSQASALSQYNLPVAVTNSTYDNANHQLVFGSYNLLYDADGNMTNMINGAITNQLVWSARNQLTNMLGAVTANFLYDGLGRRITRTVSGTTEKYLYDGLDIIEQLDGSSTVAANYLRGLAVDEPWQRIDAGAGNTNRVYLADALGNIVALTDTNKSTSTQYIYDPFGNTTSAGVGNKNSCQFTSRENDGTGFYYYRARYYNPALGRFVSEDPLRLRGGDINVYVYVRNSPLSSRDSLGLQTPPETGGASPGQGGSGPGVQDPSGANGAGLVINIYSGIELVILLETSPPPPIVITIPTPGGVPVYALPNPPGTVTSVVPSSGPVPITSITPTAPPVPYIPPTNPFDPMYMPPLAPPAPGPC